MPQSSMWPRSSIELLLSEGDTIVSCDKGDDEVRIAAGGEGSSGQAQSITHCVPQIPGQHLTN